MHSGVRLMHGGAIGLPYKVCAAGEGDDLTPPNTGPQARTPGFGHQPSPGVWTWLGQWFLRVGRRRLAFHGVIAGRRHPLVGRSSVRTRSDADSPKEH